jgi:hypothetical protein
MRRDAAVTALLASVFILSLAASSSAQGQAGGEPPIRLQGGTFLPSHGEPSLPPGLQAKAFAPGVRRTYLVQFVGPIEDAWKESAVAAGAELLEYIPDFAFKVRMTPAQAQAVRRLPSVRWIGPFHPAYKLSARLKRGGERLYTVRLERGSDAAAAASAIAAAGAGVEHQEGPVLVVRADETRLDALAQVLDVAWIEDFQLRQKHGEHAGQIMGAPTAWVSGYDGSTQTVAVADTGLGGGTATNAHPDIPASRITSIFNWPGVAGGCIQSITNDGAIDVDSGHGTHVSGLVLGGGDAAGKGKGTAPGARLVFQAVENYATAKTSFLCQLQGYTNAYYLVGIPSDLRTLFQQAYTAGARVHSNSWGSGNSGAYLTDAQNIDDFVRNHRDATVTFSAGNAGVDANADGGVDGASLADQASAKNIITVGATENDRASDYACDPSLTFTACAAQGGQNSIFTYGTAWPGNFPAAPLFGDPSAGNAEQMAAFSSRGPTDDGRIKPDVVAPGTWVLSAYSGLYRQGYDPSPNPQTGLYQYGGWGVPLNGAYKYMGGTSMSNPLVAGAAAVVRDYCQKAHGVSASAALVKATIINSAVDILDEDNYGTNDNTYAIPNFFEGWGRVNVAAAVDGSRVFRDEGPTVATNGSLSYTYGVAAGTPLKVTLVWTDPAAALSSLSRLVNDLDLLVTSPGGTVYKGNVFGFNAGGWTQPNTGLPDRANNVENVYVQAPAAGDWTITVKGYNVPVGPQSFALVVAGQSVQPVYGLTVSPPTHGSITTSDGFINCGTGGSACSHFYADGTNVPLNVVPDAGYALSAWSGACSGNGSCIVSMTQARTVGATFAVAPTPALTINNGSAAEGKCGQQSAAFTVSLSAPSQLAVTVNYTTADGTATVADGDYVAVGGTLTFAPGDLSKTVLVTVNGDVKLEGDETFTVTLSGPTNATIAGTGTGTQTILNDDVQLPAGQEWVSWANLIGAAACGPDLVKTATQQSWSAGASSTRALRGDGYVEFTIPATNAGQAMYGLGNGDTDQSFGDIDYAFYPYAGNVLLFEKGRYVGGYVPYAAGDKLRIAVQSGVVRYYKNGTELQVSTQAPVFPLRVDSSLLDLGVTVQGAVLYGNLADVWGAATEPVVWTNLAGATVSGGSDLVKSAAQSWWNAGASSTRGINGDGFVEFTVPVTHAEQAMFGLSNGDTDQSFADIDYAFYTYAGNVSIFEKGAYAGGYVPYAAGDKLRITVESGSVRYWKNGTLLYASGQAPKLPLRVDTSLLDPGVTVKGAVLSGTLVDVWATGGTAVVWTNLIGTALGAGNDLVKTSPQVVWNAGASSTRGIQGDGYAEFTVPPNNAEQVMFGLSHGDANQYFGEINYAFYTYAGNVLIFENGSYVAGYVPYSAGDTLRISVESDVVKYWQNGTLLFTSGQTPVYPLRVDTSLLDPGVRVKGTVLSGTLVDVWASGGQPVNWVNRVGVDVTAENDLVKTDPGVWWGAGASSAQAIDGSGYVEFTVPVTNAEQAMFGLGSNDSSPSFGEINYAFYTYAGRIFLFEDGSYVGGYVPYSIDDRLRISVEAGVVKYWQNGTLLLTSSQIASGQLHVDTSLLDPGVTVHGAVMAGTIVP